LLNDGTAPKCDRRPGNIVFVNEVQINKVLPTISINVMGNTKAEYRPFINVTTQGVTGTWLYDTGASVSCMSLTQFRRIALDNRPVKQTPQIRLLSAAKTEINVIGLFHLKIKILGKTFEHPVHVCHPMNQGGIIGMDIITRLGLTYLPARKSFTFDQHIAVGQSKQYTAQTIFKNSAGVVAEMLTDRQIKIPPHSSKVVHMNCASKQQHTTVAGATAVANIYSSQFPLLWGGPAIIQTNFKSKTSMPLINCGPTELTIPRGTAIGHLETIFADGAYQVDEAAVEASLAQAGATLPSAPSAARAEQILREATITVPESEKQKYKQLLIANHDIFSVNKHDLGRANNFTHKISLKNKAPVYVPQYRLADTHKQALDKQIDEWLKIGVIQPTNSRYNSPIFVVPKKNGENRYVLDYRALNANSHDDRYTMRTVDECIAEIGKSGSTIFSTMDLSSGYHQMLLEKNSRAATAFTVPGKGQFEWLTTSMGLRGAVSSFQRMVELTMKGVHNLIVYIDDLLAHSKNHEEHRQLLQTVFNRLRHTGLKANLTKCHFGSPNVAYLGFQLTPQGVLPGKDKLAAVRDSKPPRDVHQVRQFLGLVNFFRAHVRNFSMVASPLTQLTRKDTPWRGGPLPPDAFKAYTELKQILCSQPLVAYPRPDRPFALIVDAAAGITKTNAKGERTFRQEGGLGAILCQPDHKGELHVIAYASRALQEHEKNYTPFLLEMLACCWGIDHFEVYLRGRKFVIYSDHRPLEKLSCVHTKTLNRLQEKMNNFDFIIQYKKGSEMPADFLSRNALEEINVFTPDLPLLQARDEFANAVIEFLQHNKLPADKKKAVYIKHIGQQCFLEDNILWRRLARHNAPTRTVLVVPSTLTDKLIHETHGALLAGHEGISKTKERLLQSYFWPNMDKEIARHVEACQKCQARRRDVRPTPNLLTPLPQCTALNQRVHMDLFGPLKVSNQGKKFVLCLTDAFTKYAVMIAIDNKEAATVAKHIFESWICKFGTPLEFVSDNGKEFCNNLAKELYALLQIKHSTTTPYWPQCNSQAEVANKTIQKYLASFVDSTTLDWPVYMAPMAFAYNTSVHRSIKTTPFFLTHGVEPRYPSFPNPDVQRYYGESQAADWFNTLQHCRQIAVQHSLGATDAAEKGYNTTAQTHTYTQGQMVWLNETNYLGRNRKLSPNWTGPHLIIKVLEHGVVELLIKNRRVKVNVGRIKPTTPPLTQPQQPQQDTQQQPPQQPQVTQPPGQAGAPARDQSPYRERDDPFPHAALLPQLLQPPPQEPPQQPEAPQVAQQQQEPAPAKRGRGRPRKDAGGPPPPPAPPLGAQQAQQQQQQQPETEGPMTRARARALERYKMAPNDAIRLIRKVNTAAARHFTPVPHFDVSEGPDFVSDDYGLPKQIPGVKQPAHLIRRRKFLKSLSPQQRNLLLTGDPVFAFDPLAYQVLFFSPRPPQLLQEQFDYLAPGNPQPQPQPAGEQRPPTPPPLPPPPVPAAPVKRHVAREVVIRPQIWPTPADGASPFMVDPTSPGATSRWMRSSTASTPPYLQPSPPASGWGDFLKKTREVAHDLLNVPPPGWKPPKPHRPPPEPPKQKSILKRTASQIRHEIMHPPQPFPPQQGPARPTGTRPKQPK
jgi:transposase InsO family protein